MANKITALNIHSAEEHGALNQIVLYWYSGFAPILDSKGNKIVPRTQADLPAAVIKTGANAYVTAGDLTALDAGDAGFELLMRQKLVGETTPQFAARVLADHTARQAWWVQRLRDSHALGGAGAS